MAKVSTAATNSSASSELPGMRWRCGHRLAAHRSERPRGTEPTGGTPQLGDGGQLSEDLDGVSHDRPAIVEAGSRQPPVDYGCSPLQLAGDRLHNELANTRQTDAVGRQRFTRRHQRWCWC